MYPALEVLFVTPECRPLVQTGGLGDVSEALPRALAALGVDVRVLLPAYPQALAQLPGARELCRLPALPGFPPARLLAAESAHGVPLLLLDCPPLFQREGGPYQAPDGTDHPDNQRRFAALSHAAALLASGASPLPWRPRVLHGNDWQCGLAPIYLAQLPGPRAATVMAIHNLAYQGVYPLADAAALGLPPSALGMDGVEYYGNMSFLKAGLRRADHVVTVSPSYAREIQSAPLGMGLEGLLAWRAASLTGILNGIDDEAWDPARDPHLPEPYDARRLPAKAASRAALCARLGLAADRGVPVLSMVTRLTHQKGIDLVLEAAPRILALPARLAVLGSGDAALEAALGELCAAHPGQAALVTGFDEPLAHLLQAGADFFLMPSRFEPCGLAQMYAQRYGTPPIVRATGGLADTVLDAAGPAAWNPEGSGFSFRDESADALVAAVERAVACWHEPLAYARVQANGMARDFGWRASASAYLSLYRELAPGGAEG